MIIVRRRTCEAGVSFLRDTRTAVAVCDESLSDGFWHDAATSVSLLPDALAFIVIGDDEALAQEVQALGELRAVVQPLRESDVLWTIASASDAWVKHPEAGEPKCSRA